MALPRIGARTKQLIDIIRIPTLSEKPAALAELEMDVWLLSGFSVSYDHACMSERNLAESICFRPELARTASTPTPKYRSATSGQCRSSRPLPDDLSGSNGQINVVNDRRAP